MMGVEEFGSNLYPGSRQGFLHQNEESSEVLPSLFGKSQTCSTDLSHRPEPAFQRIALFKAGLLIDDSSCYRYREVPFSVIYFLVVKVLPQLLVRQNLYLIWVFQL